MSAYTPPTFAGTCDPQDFRDGLTDLATAVNGAVDGTNLTATDEFVSRNFRRGANVETWREGSDQLSTFFNAVFNTAAAPPLGSYQNQYWVDGCGVRFYLHEDALQLTVRSSVALTFPKSLWVTGAVTVSWDVRARIYVDGIAVGTEAKRVMTQSTGEKLSISFDLSIELTSGVFTSSGWHEAAVLLDFSNSTTSLATSESAQFNCGGRGTLVRAVYG
jgi:hypothetical protein